LLRSKNTKFQEKINTISVPDTYYTLSSMNRSAEAILLEVGHVKHKKNEGSLVR
jgi:hypothetical protein